MRLAVAALTLLLACALPPRSPDSELLRAPDANRGSERYSAWFADSDGRIVYFGLSPFWDLWWAGRGDSSADLQQPGDHLIGRFDLEREEFLEPLRVRAAGPDSRSSVWDVLAHSNGRVYYTTYFEELGWADPRSGEVGWFAGVGRGFNELVEGPQGRLYLSRYSDAPGDVDAQRYGALVVLEPDGALVQELRFEIRDGVFTAPKSVAVDPASGEVWLNADVFRPDGAIGHATLRVAADGRLLERSDEPPELHFMNFDARGRGWFVEDREGELFLLLRRAGEPLAELALGPRAPSDFAQDIHFTHDGRAVIAFWSGRVFVASERAGRLHAAALTLRAPPECRPPRRSSLFYSAFANAQHVYATLFCGAAIVRARLPSLE